MLIMLDKTYMPHIIALIETRQWKTCAQPQTYCAYYIAHISRTHDTPHTTKTLQAFYMSRITEAYLAFTEKTSASYA
jgi:hypothetical protein